MAFWEQPVANSAIHKASIWPATVQNVVWRAFQLPAPFTAYGGFRNCTRQNHGTAGNREAGGFVNSAVRSRSFVNSAVTGNASNTFVVCSNPPPCRSNFVNLPHPDSIGFAEKLEIARTIHVDWFQPSWICCQWYLDIFIAMFY